jgi:hypothetical protein
MPRIRPAISSSAEIVPARVRIVSTGVRRELAATTGEVAHSQVTCATRLTGRVAIWIAGILAERLAKDN